ncbi:Na+/proline symporter/nitrogen-specific signal transduction histidine kinase [Natronocella acetinitrilica]|uniref:histidine kinase n=1 Tax=Natronocella acetinitrilica TaxID=414046 RepID=A0AAE3G333_9GAMM|nr:sensor histidine kinase [Natronocella acetinitrilica]MCP1674754.1 Na+/proline symporter/nitrogen-specific signal transduction histidine kinase [Natronocella acetinitrilica]
MLPEWVILLTPFVYLGLLFAIAYFADQRANTTRSLVNNPYIYTLSIAVYCTAWTFYGSVGRAAQDGVSFLTIYLGPTLMAVLWWVVLRKMVRISKIHRITSIADFIGSRYGKSMLLAGLATFIAVVGITPYIALQLKAVSASFEVLLQFPNEVDSAIEGGLWRDKALYVAAVLALFAILFGTRHIDATERLEGMVVAVAFESLVKLLAFLAVGFFVTFMVFNGPADIVQQVAAQPALESLLEFSTISGGYGTWMALTILSMAAILFLPRQFQVTVVENVNEDHLRTAAWMFPLYLLLINLFVIPIALAGLLYFGDTPVNPDNYVLALPLAEGRELLAMFVYIGGFSAATGMVIVATIALAIMVSNDLVVPALLRFRHMAWIERIGMRPLIIYMRRAIIVGLLMLGYGYFRLIAESYALVSIGLISFVAVAQFAPPILLGIYWKGASRAGALAGLAGGFIVWLYTLFLPSLGEPEFVYTLVNAPAGTLASLVNPHALLGLGGMDPIAHSLFWSMLINLGALILVSLFTRQSDIERIQATLFVEVFERSERDTRFWQGTATVGDLEALLSRFIGPRQAASAIAAYGERQGEPLTAEEQAPADLVNSAERLLSGNIGSASARVMISSIVKGEALSFEGVMEILDATSQAIEYSRQLEQKSRELEQATSELRAANERLKELDRLKDDFVSMVSHELRTPLTSIRAFAEILLSEPEMAETQRQEFLDVVVKETERLTRLINQVLDLSKIESGWGDWQLHDLDLRDMVEDAVNATSQLFSEQGVRLDLALPEQPCVIKGDSDRLIQLIINLLSNAVKFTDPERGPVSLSVTQQGSWLRLQITDAGPGIPPEEHQRIFEKFHQISNQQAGKPKGSGLGLAICKRITDLHWGRIGVESVDGEGASFIVHLPEAGGEHCDFSPR